MVGNLLLKRMQQGVLLGAVALLLTLLSPRLAPAFPIHYYFTDYYGEVAAWDSESSYQDSDDDLPIDLYVGGPRGSWAQVECIDGSYFEAIAQVPYGRSCTEATLVATFKFIASFPQIVINYDYDLIVNIINIHNNEGSSQVSCILRDQTEGVTIYEYSPMVIKNNKSGSVAEVLDLINGHNYSLTLKACADVYIADYSYECFSGARMRNISIMGSNVPSPATWLLLSSGLAGLWGWRRLRRGR